MISSTAYNELVTIIIGKDAPKTFTVHKGLLGHYSEYFACAFGNPNWAEADGTGRLPDDDPEVFQLFKNFIYAGRLTDDTRLAYHVQFDFVNRSKPVCLVAEDGDIETAKGSRNDTVNLSFAILAKLAAFADMRIIPVLADTVASLILQKILMVVLVIVTTHVKRTRIATATTEALRYPDVGRLINYPRREGLQVEGEASIETIVGKAKECVEEHDY